MTIFRAVAGYTLFIGAPSAEQTALALHQAINTKANPGWPVYGLPDILYSDHGSDFTSARLNQVCLDTHILLIHSRVGVPQGGGKLERFYGTITTELLPHLPGHRSGPHPGTTRRNPRTLHRDQIQLPPPFADAPDPGATLGSFRVHPRPPAHPKDLDLLLLTATAARKVQRDGIQFASTRYLSPVLAAYIGEQITVRFNPRDVGEIRIYFNDAYLCRAIAPEVAANSVSLKELQAARSQQRRSLKHQLRQRRRLADALPTDTRYVPLTLENAEPEFLEEIPPRHRLRLYDTE